MGGLILDNVVIFLFRAFTRWWRLRRSISWPVTEGTILQTGYELVYPRSTLEYRYRVGEEEFTGQYRRGFWYGESAYNYNKHFFPGTKVVIRYCPEEPARSFLEDQDERSQALVPR